MQYIGKLNKKKLGKYSDKIITNKVVLTDERKEHIRRRHSGNYEKYIGYLSDVIENPDYILEDVDNKDTILVLKSIIEEIDNIQIVIKLKTNIGEKDKSNSILTF